MIHSFVSVASTCVPIQVANCNYNAQQICQAVKDADEKGIEILCFPELCITGYTCQDLFFQSTLQSSALDALHTIVEQTKHCVVLFTVGLPLVIHGALYNCAVVLQNGSILGVIPKTFLPNYQEFYEQRNFTSAPDAVQTISLLGQTVPFGTQILFSCQQNPNCIVAVEICEDLWAAVPPSSFHALAGATIILNLSASNEITGKASIRQLLIQAHSARTQCGYVYACAGVHESTTDLVFANHHLIAENGEIICENKPFGASSIHAELDTERLMQERIKNTSFAQKPSPCYQTVSFSLTEKHHPFQRMISKLPFLEETSFDAQEAFNIQIHALKKRFEHTSAKTAVIGISGGLDSTLALLVVVHTFLLMKLPLSNIIAITMPCFGTSSQTKSNAHRLCEALGISLREIPITQTVRRAFEDIEHCESKQDVTFENTQARVRTLVLMNLANQNNGLVIGTGDLSELALGWATYNGDHMSMYAVNASLPKTAIQNMVSIIAQTSQEPLRKILCDILATPISPELLPPSEDTIAQKTESLVGPYELHDFFLYYCLRFGFSPAKIFFLAQNAFAEQYSAKEIQGWMHQFYRRFFSQQFKRNCMPDGPKVGVLSLSPRGDFRMPSDACASAWLREIENFRIKESLSERNFL